MATKKKMLQAAAGSATGGAALDITDVFSTYLYEGNGGTQVIQNGIKLGQRFGSVQFAQTTSDYLSFSSAITLSGDFTIETWLYSDSTFSAQNQILGSDYAGTGGTNNQVYLQNTSNKLGFYDGSSAHLSNGGVPQNTWSHVAITRSGSTIAFYIDGQSSGTATSSASVEFKAIGSLIALNFFKGYIADLRIVSGSVVYASNFTPPSQPLTAISGTQVLACQGSSPFSDTSNNTTITKNGSVTAEATLDPYGLVEDGEGGLVWIKSRTQTDSHYLWDTERGVNKRLSTNQPYGENNETDALNSFNSNGFTLGSAGNVNSSAANLGSAADYASWTFRKAPKFFTMVTWNGTGNENNTINHDLGCVPGMIIVKRINSSANWIVYHRGVNGGTNPEQYNLQLDNTNPQDQNSSYFSNTAPTDTTFTVGSLNSASGGTYIAYLFAHNNGDGEFGPDGSDIIKCGSYTGNGSTDGPEIDLGFEPQWIMLKETNNTGGWFIFDAMRGMPVGGGDTYLYANASDADATFSERFKVTPTGFKLATSSGSFNGSGDTYIYMAIRRGPLAPPEDATEVFDVNAYSGNSTAGRIISSGFPVDLAIVQSRSAAGDTNAVADRLRSANKLFNTPNNHAELTNNSDSITGFDFMDGIEIGTDTRVNWSSGTYVSWMWKRAPGYFDAVAYKGLGAAGSHNHNLGAVPEMVWFKARNDAQEWIVYHKDLTAGSHLRLNATNAELTGELTTSFAVSDTQFTFANDFATTNSSSTNYIAYLFASLPGISKVGSFTGNGGSQTIDCGFTSGARFVLIKRTSATSNWLVFDTERGIVSGNDPYLFLDASDSESPYGGFDEIDPHPSGFTFNYNPAGFALNGSGSELIFYAIA